jgi:glutaredoxin 3
MPAKVEIYSKDHCPYCVKAKELLKLKGAEIVEYRIDLDEEKREEMLVRANRRTVPQIFIDGAHVGGCDDLFALNDAGQLAGWLNG